MGILPNVILQNCIFFQMAFCHVLPIIPPEGILPNGILPYIIQPITPPMSILPNVILPNVIPSNIILVNGSQPKILICDWLCWLQHMDEDHRRNLSIHI
jgi:hypothetical protein